MTARNDTDRLIATWLIETNPEGPVDYLDETLSAIGGIRQRPAWAGLGRWLPWQLTLPRVGDVPRSARYLALLVLLLIGALMALAIAGGQKRLPPPFGLAATGLVTFASGDDIVATMPDGTGRRPLITGDGAQWGLTWSHRGDRFAYWSAPTTDDPASLWLADGDGSDRQAVSGGLITGVPDTLPNVSWSPDDGQLAFSDAGVLYVVNADGTGLHVVGRHDHTRGGPVWSPDGTLIAYTGQPLDDPYITTSLWVITPEGLGDHIVIPPDGGNELGTNSNPSWSPDSRSLLVHTGGGPQANSISIARRDAAGKWSYVLLVPGGPTWNFLPAWSTTGTRFTFLRAIDGTEDLVVMVADADGSNVHQLSDRHVGLATPCWSPDDRFVRAAANGTIVLLPVDGSAPVDIPTGDVPSVGCQMQRLAP